jgi:nucleoid DNA-binding protein
MLKKVILIGFSVCISTSFATADPLADSLDIRNEKNPVAALLDGDLGCQLIRPPSDIADLIGNVGSGYAGNITLPKTLKDGQTLDLGENLSLCRVTDFKFPVKTGEEDLKSVSRYIEWTDSLSASIKLTLGTWLNLLDFDATDLQTIGIAISGGSFEYDQKQRKSALRDIIKNDVDKDCTTLASKKVQQIIRTCVGHITVALESKKALSLNAFDLKFANFSVGLKASWLREVKGTGEDCDVAGLAAPGGPPGPAADPKTKNGVGTTIPIGTGSVKIDPAGNIQITFPPPTADKATVSKPSDDQVKKAGPDTPAKPKDGQPKVQDKICAKQVVYRTGTARILGVFLTDPATTVKDIKSIANK